MLHGTLLALPLHSDLSSSAQRYVRALPVVGLAMLGQNTAARGGACHQLRREMDANPAGRGAVSSPPHLAWDVSSSETLMDGGEIHGSPLHGALSSQESGGMEKPAINVFANSP